MGEGDIGDIGDVGVAGPGPADSGEMGEADFGSIFGGMDGIFGDSASAPNADSLFNLNLDQQEQNMVVDDNNNMSKSLMSLLSMVVSKASPVAGQTVNMSKAAVEGKNNPAATFAANTIMGMVNPALAVVANMTGVTDAISAALSNGNQANFSGSATGDGTGMLSEVLPSLGGMYAGYQGQKQAGNMLGGLQSLYAQDSPYAQVMRQQLQRRDAAAGRRSQYGPREVELQAQLAKMASGQIPAMTKLAENQTLARNSMYMQGLKLAQQSGLLSKLGGAASSGLESLFGGGRYDTSGMSLLNSGQLQGFGGGNPLTDNFLSNIGNDPWGLGDIWGG